MKNANRQLVFECVLLVVVALITLPGCGEPKELKTNQIRQKFKEITGYGLPKKADDLRAVYFAARDLQIFARFETDSDGIADVLKKFSRPDAKCTSFDENHLKQFIKLGAKMFPTVAHWQEKFGIHIYDEESFGCGHSIDLTSSSLSYSIYIDDQNSTVYIFAREY